MQGTLQGKSFWLAVLATSFLHAASHPPWSLWPLALLSAAPASAVLLNRRSPVSPRRAALGGLLYGAATTWLLVGQWSFAAAREFFGGSPAAALGFSAALPILASAVALPYAVAFVLLSRLAGLGATAGVIGGGSIWAAAEVARSSVGYGNPWGSFAAALWPVDAMLSSSFQASTPVAGLLALGGPPAVALFAATAGTALGLAWSERSDVRGRSRALVAGAVTVAAILAVSNFGLDHLPPRHPDAVPRDPLRVALVQSGIGGSRLWQSAGAAQSLARHIELTRSSEASGSDLVIWPENALAFLLDANPERRDELRALARERGAALLAGGSRSGRDERGRSVVFNSAFLFPADGGEPLVYDKRILLPFVEHVPAWAAPLLQSPWQGAFAEGTGPGLLDVKGWQIAPLICLEAIYPAEAASRVADGADLLVNISNDSWFDAGAGPQQHFSLSVLLAAETRRPLVRVATTGISAFVLDDGLIAWTLPRASAGVARFDVVPARRDSLYVRGGRSGFLLLIVLVSGAAALLPSITRAARKA